uniref:Uncharacterized protein n=1 Tax=Avena sativa TaxID=4498 RepID=A0ACD5VPQ2_AVESA
MEESGDGGGTGNPPGGASAAPAELLKPLDAVADETGGTSADQQPCEHFSIRRHVALQQMDATFCSLSQIFNGQKQLDKRHNSLYPFLVSMFKRWDCSKCLHKAKILDDTASKTVSMGKNVSRDGCSIRFVRSTKLPTSVDFRSLFPCIQQVVQGKNADRSTHLKSTPESNSKCNSPDEANTDPPMKDLQGSSSNQVTTANLSDNASADVIPLPEDSQIRANREGFDITIPSSPKLSEATMKPNAEDTRKNKEVLNVDHTIPNVPKPVSGQTAGQVRNRGPCEEAAPKRSAGSTCKKKKGKPIAQVGSSDVKVGRRKQIKLRLLSEIINTEPARGSRTDIEVNAEKVADPCEDNRNTDDDISVSHQVVGEIWPNATENNEKEKEVVDDESSLMDWMKKIPKKLRTAKKDSEHKDFDSFASKTTADLFYSKDMHHDFPSSGWRLSKKNALPTISTQQDDENIQNNNLERNTQSGDHMSQMEAENSTDRSLLKVKTINLSKRKMPSTANVQHDGVVAVSRQAVGMISSKNEKKTKYKGVDDDEESSPMNWMKKVPKKLRTEKKDTEHKDLDSCAANSQHILDSVASKDVHDGFVSSVHKLSQRKILGATSSGEGDEHIQHDNLERNVDNTDDQDGMSQMESGNCRQRSMSKVKKVSLSKRNIPSTVDSQHGVLSTENATGKTSILRTDGQCQMEPRKPVQRRLAKVSPGKRGRNVTALEQKIPKRKKQKQQLMPEKQAITDDIPMDIVELLARNQDERPLITETDSSDISHSKSKLAEDEDCTVIAAEDGPNVASNVFDTTSQKKPLAPDSYQKALHDRVAPTTQASDMHALRLQTPGHFNSTQEPQTHLSMGELVTIAATSPLLSRHKDHSIAEEPADCWSHKGAKKLTWDSFEAAPRDSSTSTCGAQFRSSTDAVDLTSTHVAGPSNNYYPTRQPVTSALDHYTDGSVNPVQGRSFPSAMSTMEAGNLCARRNAGQSGFYPRETLPDAHLLRLTEQQMLADFPNYEVSSRNQMEFQLRNSYYAHNQYIASASASYGAQNQYMGSASTLYGSNLNGIGSASTSYGVHNQYVRSASTSYGSHLNGIGSASALYGSNLNGKVPLTLEDLTRPQVQQNLHKPLRPHPRVGVLSSLLQKEIANLPESCGTQSGYRIGVSKGIASSFDINRRENVETLNPGMYSGAWNVLQLGSVSSSPGFSSARNCSAQSLTRDQGRMINPLDRLVKQDICVTNRNPTDFTTISDDNEFLREDI